MYFFFLPIILKNFTNFLTIAKKKNFYSKLTTQNLHEDAVYVSVVATFHNEEVGLHWSNFQELDCHKPG